MNNFKTIKYFYILIFMAIFSCQSSNQDFNAVIAGYRINFPTTSGYIRKHYPRSFEKHLIFLIDSGSHSTITWLFTQSLKDDNRQPYGVIILLKNKGNKIDSVKNYFEKLYSKNFKRLLNPEYIESSEYYEPDSTLSSLELENNIQISLCREKVWPNRSKGIYTNNLLISICYSLTNAEKERFALKRGIIEEND